MLEDNLPLLPLKWNSIQDGKKSCLRNEDRICCVLAFHVTIPHFTYSPSIPSQCPSAPGQTQKKPPLKIQHLSIKNVVLKITIHSRDSGARMYVLIITPAEFRRAPLCLQLHSLGWVQLNRASSAVFVFNLQSKGLANQASINQEYFRHPCLWH